MAMKRTVMPGKDALFPRKCILLIIDGLGDLPVPSLGGRTPLEAAVTPVLDRMAGSGRYGLVDPTAPGETPHTHSGSGALMGLSPGQAGRLSRGPVEAAGAGRVLAAGEVAVRANFATVESCGGQWLVTDRRAGRITSETAELAAVVSGMDLGDGITADLMPTNQHRGVLILRGPGLDASVSDTDPGDIALPASVKPCHALEPAAALTAKKISEFLERARELLKDHPLNTARIRAGLLPATGIITRGAGLQFNLNSTLHAQGVSAAVISGCNTVLGLGRMLGYQTVTDARFTAALDTDLEAKVAAATAALADHDLVFLHVKAPDICSHDRQPEAKRDFLQRLDKVLEPWLTSPAIIALAADHTTDSNKGSHTADPVPALIFEPGAVRAEPIKFGEATCRQGNMARQSSHEFLLEVLSRMGVRVPG
jgi:2,3-bisphosphoglycerate-independent phosphoglycerate mutase